MIHQVFLRMGRLRRDKHGVVARDRADHAGPAAAVEREADPLGRADAGPDHEQVGARRRDRTQQVADGGDLFVAGLGCAR
jgi:type IV secretory pathway TrbL component